MSTKVKIKVGFDYTGEDGTARVAGQLAEVSPAEYARRGPRGDGFVRLHDQPAATSGDQAPTVAGLPAGTSIPANDPTGLGSATTPRARSRAKQ